MLKAVDVPLIIWGCGDDEKDNVILPECSAAAKGENCLIGSAKESNYMTVVAICKADKQKIISEAPVDIIRQIEKGVKKGRRPDLIGGGLIRTAGGWAALRTYRQMKIHIKGDERILGDSDFVESVLEEQNERLERRYRIQMQGYDFDKIVERVARMFELKPKEVLSNVKQRTRVKARSLLCYWAVNELEMAGAAVARRLKMSKSAISRAVARGERVAFDMKLKLFED